METATTTLDYTAIADGMSEWLKAYAEKAGVKGFILGISGGIDSAVTSALCAKTGMPVLIIEMPIHQASAEVGRAKKHIAWLIKNCPNVQTAETDLTKSFDALSDVLRTSPFNGNVSDEDFGFTMANTRSRMRMTALYAYAGMHGLLVAGTGNKVEDFGIGFYTKYGDGGVDISPIADLMKSEVYALGAELGICEEILTAAPTDGLHSDGRTDEDQIGASYDELEWAMDWFENSYDEIDDLDDRKKEVLVIYEKFHNSNKHKMDAIPVFDTSKFRN